MTTFIKKNILICMLLFTSIAFSQLPPQYTITEHIGNEFQYNAIMSHLHIDEHCVIAERDGTITVHGNETPLIQITPHTGGERGLQRIAHFNKDGVDYIVVYYSSNTLRGTIELYHVDFDSNWSSLYSTPLDDFLHASPNHWGGAMEIYDGWLYVSFGDAGNGWYSQRDSRLNGKIIRIDPFTGAGHPDNYLFDSDNPYSKQSRTYAKGFRNPYSFHMDNNGVITVFDVGASEQEDVTRITATGQNGGWVFFEGFNEFVGTIPDNPDTFEPYVLTNYQSPLLALTHDTNTVILANGNTFDIPYNPASIIGTVLDGFGSPGDLFIMDVFRNNVLIAEFTSDEITNVFELVSLDFSSVINISQYDEDIFLSTFTGQVYKIHYDNTLNLPNLTTNNLPYGLEYKLYNTLGQLIKHDTLHENTLRELEKGLYLMRVKSYTTLKFIN